jgi:hypothetical protein
MTTIDNVKEVVKQHEIVPFSAREISCVAIGGTTALTIADKYIAHNVSEIMSALGIRQNLVKDIFNQPDQHWPTIQSALNNIDKNKRFACIANQSNEVACMATAKVAEVTQLDYDDRIDELINSIEGVNHLQYQGIVFNPITATVDINVVSNEDVDCGMNDFWKFGTTTTIGQNSQQFAQYFLRLICTNGMTTRENIAYRTANASKNIGKQLVRFMSQKNASGAIVSRVKRLQNARASLYEVNSIANCLLKDDRNSFFPEYANIQQEFKARGYDVDAFDAKRQKFIYTNENLYDVFNVATNIASHRRDIVGQATVMKLNKAAGDIFTKGPNLDFNVLDIFNN